MIDLPRFNIIHSIKESIEKSFFKLLPKEYVGMLEGMIIGDTSYISEEVEENFRNCGITHLLAVSGANVAYILILCKYLFEKLFGRNISNVLSIIFIILFTLLSGASPSVVRAAIMAITIIFSELLSQKSNTYASISLSALIILLYNPIIICDVGFLLSFAGTIGIIILNDKIKNFIKEKINCDTNVLIETLSITLAAQIAVLPITMYYFNTISCVSLFVNLIAVPITGSITVLGILMYFLSLIIMPFAKIISFIIYELISFVFFVSKFFSSLPFSSIIIPTPSILFVITYYLIIFYLLKKNDIKNKSIFKKIIIVLIIFQFVSIVIPNNHLKVNMVDVGQGDCIYIETPHKKTILVDTGGTEGSDYDIGERILVPYLLDRGKMKVDYVFISHFHEDHAEGLLTLLDSMKINNIIINKQMTETDLYKRIIEKAQNSKTNIITIKEGDKIEVDGVIFEILLSNEDMENLNNTSVVMKMTYGETSMIFTGDAERELEECAKTNVKSAILKVPHHGSNTSTTDDFLRRVSPQIALISAGVNNKFGHPRQEIIDKLEERNISIYRTDLNGEIIMKLYKNGKIKIATYLQE